MRTNQRTPRRAATAGVAALLGGVLASCGGATEPRERVRTYEVAEARVPCMAIDPTECLRVRTPPTVEWQLFYSAIDGFTYEPGYRYVLVVAERDVPNPPADGSSIAYRLVRLVSKTAVAP